MRFSFFLGGGGLGGGEGITVYLPFSEFTYDKVVFLSLKFFFPERCPSALRVQSKAH